MVSKREIRKALSGKTAQKIMSTLAQVRALVDISPSVGHLCLRLGPKDLLEVIHEIEAVLERMKRLNIRKWRDLVSQTIRIGDKVYVGTIPDLPNLHIKKILGPDSYECYELEHIPKSKEKSTIKLSASGIVAVIRKNKCILHRMILDSHAYGGPS